MLLEGHYYKHNDSDELVIILKIDLENGFCTSRIVNRGELPTSELVAPIDFYLFNYRHYSP